MAGRPLIAWTIEAALGAGVLERLVVSTDDEEIAAVARSFGAEVPFRRPAELAQDGTPGIDPVLHALDWLEENEGYRPDYVLLLQPTSPLRTSRDIAGVVAVAAANQADAVVSVTPAGDHPYWMKSVTQDGRLDNFLSFDTTYACRQDLPPAHAINGAAYLVQPAVLRRHRSFYTDRTFAYVMPRERSIDIDTVFDFKLAELIVENGLSNDDDDGSTA